MNGHAINDYEKFVQNNELPTDLRCEYMLTNDGRTEELIVEYGRNAQVDLIVMGSKGRTVTSAILIGSLAEKIVFKSTDIPILIVKSRGENMGFLEAFLKI
jgi:K+-sensing histidine kinase KdpD